MSDTGPRHVPRFTQALHGEAGDSCLHSRSCERNGPPLIAVLAPYLNGCRGAVLEIGAGTGQHAAAFALAFPNLDWIASDVFPEHRASIRAWADALLPEPRTALDLDAATDWASLEAVRALGPLTAVYAGNVAHIAPWEVTLGILRGAAQRLAPEGRLFLYGPFRDGSEYFGPGNRAFDRGLRQDDPAWGLRDLNEIGAAGQAVGLALEAVHPMPANNHLLVLRRAG